jgi:predicted ATP-dependent serine protease
MPPQQVEAPLVLYVSAEESVEQIANRAQRLGIHNTSNLMVYSATMVEVPNTFSLCVCPLWGA